MSRAQTRQIIRTGLSLFIGFFLLWLISRGQNWDLILEEVHQVNYAWLLLAVLASALSHWLRALRWRQLIREAAPEPRLSNTFYALMTGYLSNLAIPRLGELTRCLVLSRSGRIPLNSLVGTVVAERAFDLFSLITIVVLTIAFQFAFLRDFLFRFFIDPLMLKGIQYQNLLLLSAAAGLILAGLLIWLFYRKMKNPEEGSIWERIRRQYFGLQKGVLTIWYLKGKRVFLVYSALIWLLYFLTVYLVFFALPGTSQLGVATGFTLLAVGSLGVAAPVPGGIGTYHFLTILTLTELYGIMAESATSYAYIAHAAQVLVSVALGSFSWFLISLRTKKGLI